MSKGSKRRPRKVSQDLFTKNWERVFAKWEERRIEKCFRTMEMLDKVRKHKGQIRYKKAINDSNEQTG